MVQFKTVKFAVAMPDGMEIPDYQKLIELAVAEQVKRFNYYKNSWKNKEAFLADGTRAHIREYLMEHIKKKVAEIEVSNSHKEELKLHADLMNLASMRFHRVLLG